VYLKSNSNEGFFMKLTKYILFLFVLMVCSCACSAELSPTLTSTLKINGGKTIISHVTSIETTNGVGLKSFGSNFVNGSYSYQGSDTKILTNGQTGISRDASTTGQMIAADTTVKTAGQMNAFISTGVVRDQANIPAVLCDSNDVLAGGASDSGKYPSHQDASGLYGVMASGKDGKIATYKSSTTVSDTTMAASNTIDFPVGYYYDNTLVDVRLGFDKNTTGLNFASSEHVHNVVADNETLGGAFGIAELVFDDSTVIAEDDTINENITVSNQTYEGASTERLDDYTNETTNQTEE
jgi:hypothetical protein